MAARPFACGDIVLFFIISILFCRLCADAQQDNSSPKANCLKNVSNLSQICLAQNRPCRRVCPHPPFHLNREGEYLQACVWLAALFDCDVTKLTYCPDFLPETRAVQMRKSAMAAVKP